MDALRARWIAEARGMDKKTLARTVLEASHLEAGAPLDDAMRARVAATLVKFGKPAVEAKTWGDAFEALTGDIDGDGATDLDWEAANELGVPLASPGTVRVEQTIVSGGDDAVQVDLARGVVTLAVRLVLDTQGRFSPFTGDVPEGASAIGEVSLETVGEPQLIAGNTSMRPSYPLRLPGLPLEVGNALMERLLAVEAPAGTQLDAALKQLAAQKRFYELPRPPADPAQAVLWRAAHLDSQHLDAMTRQLTAKYGVRPLRYTGYVNDLREAPLAKAVLEAARPQNGITPAFLYAIAMGEGLGSWADTVDASGDGPVSGFGNLGVDTFGTRAAELKRRLLLPASFEEGVDYTLAPAQNEKGEQVVSAGFPNVKSGLVALNAMLADERRRFLGDARAVLGPEKAERLTQDQINYFTYVYFNAGPGFGRRHLETQGLTAAEKWKGPAPEGNRMARYNALQRISTWRLIEGAGIFP